MGYVTGAHRCGMEAAGWSGLSGARGGWRMTASRRAWLCGVWWWETGARAEDGCGAVGEQGAVRLVASALASRAAHGCA